MNDDLDDLMSRIALHVSDEAAEDEPTMFDDADVLFSRKLKRLKMWGWPERYGQDFIRLQAGERLRV